MRRNGYSTALRDFEIGHGRAKSLYRIECKHYKDPPPQDQQAAVDALRGGATVLLVASIEQFLKDALEEYVWEISQKAASTRHPKLPLDFCDLNDFEYIATMLKSRKSKAEKILEVRRVASLIATSGFIPESFSSTQANPGPTTVTKLLKDFGVLDPFAKIEAHFGRHFKHPFHTGDVRSTLDGLVTARNQVAHGLGMSSRSRLEIKKWVVFSTAFGRAADNALRDRTIDILNNL